MRVVLSVGQFADDVYVEGGVGDLIQRLEVAQGGDVGALLEGFLQEAAEAGQTVRVVAQRELAADKHSKQASVTGGRLEVMSVSQQILSVCIHQNVFFMIKFNILSN